MTHTLNLNDIKLYLQSVSIVLFTCFYASQAFHHEFNPSVINFFDEYMDSIYSIYSVSICIEYSDIHKSTPIGD